jgi:hypothetical protein
LPKIKVILERQFKDVSLLIDDKGQTYIFWRLTPKQRLWLGKKLFWLTCFAKADLCEKHLKRPHLTCITCKILKVVSGKIPFLYPVIVRQIWQQTNMSVLQAFLYKNSLSLSEMLS